MFCPNCGKTISDQSIFCRYCGTSIKDILAEQNAPVAEPIIKPMIEEKIEPAAQPVHTPSPRRFCKSCGTETAPGVRFCKGCGAPVQNPASTAQQSAGISAQAVQQFNAAANRFNISNMRLAVVLASAAGMISAFLPWLKSDYFMTATLKTSIAGTDANTGWAVIAVFGIAAAIALLGDRLAPIVGKAKNGILAMGGINAFIGIYQFIGDEEIQKIKEQIEFSYEIGLYLLVVASIALILIPFVMNNTNPN
jgi:uncharacterized OB-fold protein